MAMEGNEPRKQNKEFIYSGFKNAPIAMFLTLQSLAIIGLFFWCINLSSKTSDNAEKQVMDARADADKQVERILQILRPDLQQIKENVQQAKENVDTVKNTKK